MNNHDSGSSTGGLHSAIERKIEAENRGMEYTAFLSRNESGADEFADHIINKDRSAGGINYRHLNSLPFTYKNMVDLIHAYKAALWIEDFFLTATNMTPDIPLLQNLRHLDDLLCDLSPVYDKNQDYEEQPFSHIIEDKHLNIEEKAMLLMGDNSAESVDRANSISTTKENEASGTASEELSDSHLITLPFAVADMINLIRAYDAFQSLKDLVSLTGGIDPRNRIIVWLGSIEVLLKDLSPLYVDGIEQRKCEFEMILADNSLDLPFRARLLLGSQRDLEVFKEPSMLRTRTNADIHSKNKANGDDLNLVRPFTEKNMADLLTAIYAYENLDEVLEMFTGTYVDNDIIYGLCHLKEVLNNISPRYHRDLDDDTVENLEYYHALESLDVGLQDKTRWMMGDEL